MNLRVKTSNFEMTTDVSAYLDEKLVAIKRLLHETSRCEVELGRTAGHPHQGKIWKAEIVVHHEGERLYALAEEESVNAAIDIAKDEMLQLLRKNKGRHATLARRMGARLKSWTRFGQR